MIKIWLFIFLILLPFCAQAGVVFVQNRTDRSLLIVYQICYDDIHCGNRHQFTLAPNKEVAVDITPDNFFSIISVVSDGPDIDAWKGHWSSGLKIGPCTAQPLSTTSIVGNRITLDNFGGSPEIICTVSTSGKG